MKTYGSTEILRKTGVTKMQLIHWTQRGVIVPLKDARGRGRSRIYSHQNLIETMICKQLNAFRVETTMMKLFMDHLRGAMGKIINSKETLWEHLVEHPDTDLFLYLGTHSLLGMTLNEVVSPLSDRAAKRLSRSHPDEEEYFKISEDGKYEKIVETSTLLDVKKMPPRVGFGVVPLRDISDVISQIGLATLILIDLRQIMKWASETV